MLWFRLQMHCYTYIVHVNHQYFRRYFRDHREHAYELQPNYMINWIDLLKNYFHDYGLASAHWTMLLLQHRQYYRYYNCYQIRQ
nr:MAG TPA: hypothetical protein [Caudoviricetes sp.]